MMTTLIVIGWIICGILAYGIAKNCDRQHYSKMNHLFAFPYGYHGGDEFLCITTGLCGLLGLFSAIIETLIYGYNFGLCFKMPEYLCESRQERGKTPQKYHCGNCRCGPLPPDLPQKK